MWLGIRRMVKLFQSTPPCGERLPPDGYWQQARQFQSTPPCGERQESRALADAAALVSIHAPVRGATGADLAIYP